MTKEDDKQSWIDTGLRLTWETNEKQQINPRQNSMNVCSFSLGLLTWLSKAYNSAFPSENCHCFKETSKMQINKYTQTIWNPR